MSWTPEEGLAWAIRAMQAHADNVRLLVHESFATADAVPAHDLNRLLLTLEELADELDKVSMNCAELLPPVRPHDQTASITSEEEALAAEVHGLPSPPALCRQCHIEAEYGDYDSDQSRGV
jgi:hypothetical protein